MSEGFFVFVLCVGWGDVVKGFFIVFVVFWYVVLKIYL